MAAAVPFMPAALTEGGGVLQPTSRTAPRVAGLECTRHVPPSTGKKKNDVCSFWKAARYLPQRALCDVRYQHRLCR
eukprot:3200272-Rhodomonas_salina.1